MAEDMFDAQAFDAWLAGDPRRGPVFETMWRRVMGSDMDAALGAYARRGASTRARVAAGAALLLVLSGGYNALPLVERHLARPALYRVADGKIRAVVLADGTRMTLAGGAEAKVRYTRHDRIVELTHGAMFVHVTHDPQRPFQVDTGEARIVDVGTSFEILSRPSNIRVTVASGAVRFGRDGWFSKPIELAAKQAAILDRRGLNRTADVDADDIARWRKEWVEYKGAPLRQVVADLQKLSPLPIEIDDARLASRPMSGRIRLTDPVGQLQNLSIIYDFRVHDTGRSLVIAKD